MKGGAGVDGLERLNLHDQPERWPKIAFADVKDYRKAAAQGDNAAADTRLAFPRFFAYR